MAVTGMPCHRERTRERQTRPLLEGKSDRERNAVRSDGARNEQLEATTAARPPPEADVVYQRGKNITLRERRKKRGATADEGRDVG